MFIKDNVTDKLVSIHELKDYAAKYLEHEFMSLTLESDILRQNMQDKLNELIYIRISDELKLLDIEEYVELLNKEHGFELETY